LVPALRRADAQEVKHRRERLVGLLREHHRDAIRQLGDYVRVKPGGESRGRQDGRRHLVARLVVQLTGRASRRHRPASERSLVHLACRHRSPGRRGIPPELLQEAVRDREFSATPCTGVGKLSRCLVVERERMRDPLAQVPKQRPVQRKSVRIAPATHVVFQLQNGESDRDRSETPARKAAHHFPGNTRIAGCRATHPPRVPGARPRPTARSRRDQPERRARCVSSSGCSSVTTSSEEVECDRVQP
jgi:hypothetical protein